MAILNPTQRATLERFKRALSGDLTAIDALFGVTGDGSGVANFAERKNSDLFLRALVNDPAAIDALCGVSGLPAEQAALVQMRAALEGDAAALDALMGGLGYNGATDLRVIDWWEPGSLANKSISSKNNGALVATLGAVTTASNVKNGQPAWQTRKASPGILVSALGQATFTPTTYLIVARVAPTFTPALNDTWLGAKAGGQWLDWVNSTHLGFGSTAFNVASDPTAFQLHTIYAHENYSRYGLNMGAYGAQFNAAQMYPAGAVLGAFNAAGTFPADADFLFYLTYQGQMSDVALAWWRNYIETKWALGLAASPPAQIDLSSPAIGGLFASGSPWVEVPTFGQSNAKTNSTAATTAPAGNTFYLGRDSTYKTMVSLYEGIANSTDRVAADTVGGSVLGGIGAPLMNAVVARFAKPSVLISNAKGGSHLIQGVVLPANSDLDWWGREAGNGSHQRDTVYWQAVARTRDGIAKGGTVPYAVWYQGESEGLSTTPTFAPQIASVLPAFLTQLALDCGMPDKWIIVCPPPTVPTGATPSTWAAMRTAILACDNGVNHFVITATDGPFESDLLHLQGAALNSTGAAIDTKAAAVGFN